MNRDVINVIKQRKIKDLKKLVEYMKKTHPDIPKTEIKKTFDKYNKKRTIKQYDRALMGNKFSAIRGAWQMDIYIVVDMKFLLLVNVNTKYAWIRRIKRVDSKHFLKLFKQFVREFEPRIIECDEEAAFKSIDSLNYMISQNIVLKLTPKKYHAYLSVLNKVCRTLNDKIYYEDNIREERLESSEDRPFEIVEVDELSDRQYSHDEHDVIDENIEHLVDVYNDTYNAAIGMTPREMMESKDSEIAYIYKQFEVRDVKDKMRLKYPINVGDKVRFIIDEDRGQRKYNKNSRRRQLSEDYYVVVKQVSPYLYEIAGKDGLTKAVPRYRLMKIENTLSKKLGDSVNYELDYIGEEHIYKITAYEIPKRAEPTMNNCVYHVNLARISKDGKRLEVERRTIERTVRQLRDRLKHPTTLTDLERDFLRKHQDEYYYDNEKKLILRK